MIATPSPDGTLKQGGLYLYETICKQRSELARNRCPAQLYNSYNFFDTRYVLAVHLECDRFFVCRVRKTRTQKDIW